MPVEVISHGSRSHSSSPGFLPRRRSMRTTYRIWPRPRSLAARRQAEGAPREANRWLGHSA